MQNTSKAYKQAMKNQIRNNGYIRAYIGVINSDAQKEVSVNDSQNQFTYFSSPNKVFESEPVTNLYATYEQDFSFVDGSVYFLPRSPDKAIFNNGLITEDLLGSVCIRFNRTGLDIKGLTIDFGRCYPVDFTVENDEGVHSYNNNDKSYWTTEDVFRGTSYFKITPSRMVNGQGRLRIYEFLCGIVNTFTNRQVINGGGYSFKEVVSSISDSLPSQDMTLTVDNHNLYYNPDNPDSALAFMDTGQEIRVALGYDTDGRGTIEWMPEQTCYLKTWTANDQQAKFTATDIFDYMSDTYYKGSYRHNGISLYDLAADVMKDAGIDKDAYFVDPYLKKVTVNNPMPPVKHTEALQIIANAGRCVLYPDRDRRIRIQSSFIPDMVASANEQSEFSHVENVLKDDKKDAYAMYSRDFSVTDGTVLFMPREKHYLNTGFVSEAIADSNGHFSQNPKITIELEAAFVAFGLLVRFRNVAPQEMKVTTFYEGVEVESYDVTEPELTYTTHKMFQLFDRMELEFTRGHPNSRITVDNVIIGDVTDYTLTYSKDLSATPAGTRQSKIKSINVQRSVYHESAEEAKELQSEEITVSPVNTEYTVHFSNPSYALQVSVVENASVTCTVIESSNYYAILNFSGVSSEMVVKYSITGKEYVVDTNFVAVQHNPNGEVKEWNNPLISTTEHAKELEEWLASYYLGDVDYSINWRGDPSVDANDLFYLELKDRQTPMIRTYENTLKFGGSFSGQMKARKVVLYGGNKS